MKLALTAALLLHVAWLVAAQDVLKDASPHRQEFVSVDDSTRLEVLDWGGTGRSLVFLSGIGDTAHVFDTFAPRFSNRFRVIGITRRGFGASSRPLSGYTVPRLAKDIEVVLDALHIHEPVLIGHSIAGEEMSYIAARKSIRLGGLVYLEAAYDHTRPDALIKVVVHGIFSRRRWTARRGTRIKRSGYAREAFDGRTVNWTSSRRSVILHRVCPQRFSGRRALQNTGMSRLLRWRSTSSQDPFATYSPPTTITGQPFVQNSMPHGRSGLRP
jgi:pimeloyl-ACP methyl ester carboxylesterase